MWPYLTRLKMKSLDSLVILRVAVSHSSFRIALLTNEFISSSLSATHKCTKIRFNKFNKCFLISHLIVTDPGFPLRGHQLGVPGAPPLDPSPVLLKIDTTYMC